MDQKISTGYLKILLRYILASSKLYKKKKTLIYQTRLFKSTTLEMYSLREKKKKLQQI